MGFLTIISQNNTSKQDNNVPLCIQLPYGSLIDKHTPGQNIFKMAAKTSKMAAKIYRFCKLLINNQRICTIKALKSVFNLYWTFWNKNNQNPSIFKGVMVLARNREITEKQVFCINGHEILIFHYYSKNKFCSNSDFTHTYQFLYKLVY